MPRGLRHSAVGRPDVLRLHSECGDHCRLAYNCPPEEQSNFYTVREKHSQFPADQGFTLSDAGAKRMLAWRGGTKKFTAMWSGTAAGPCWSLMPRSRSQSLPTWPSGSCKRSKHGFACSHTLALLPAPSTCAGAVRCRRWCCRCCASFEFAAAAGARGRSSPGPHFPSACMY